MTHTVRLLGLAFADLDAHAAARVMAARPRDAAFGYVVTPNADHLVRLARDPAMAAIYASAWLRLLDSRVVAGAARLLGLAVPRVAPGSDVTALLLLRHLRPGERITIIGLRAVWLPALTARCDLVQPAHFDPPIGFEHDPAALAAAVDFVCTHPARFVFLAVGSPRQEILAAAIAATGRATGLGLCVGASLEFLAGARPRAPRWMQVAGLEWVFRLCREPLRLAPRYLRDSPKVLALLWKERRSSGTSPGSGRGLGGGVEAGTRRCAPSPQPPASRGGGDFVACWCPASLIPRGIARLRRASRVPFDGKRATAKGTTRGPSRPG